MQNIIDFIMKDNNLYYAIGVLVLLAVIIIVSVSLAKGRKKAAKKKEVLAAESAAKIERYQPVEKEAARPTVIIGEAKPQEVEKPKVVEAPPKAVEKPKAVEVQPKTVEKPKIVEAQPKAVEKPKAAEVKPKEADKPKAIEVQPKEIEKPKAAEAKAKTEVKAKVKDADAKPKTVKEVKTDPATKIVEVKPVPKKAKPEPKKEVVKVTKEIEKETGNPDSEVDDENAYKRPGFIQIYKDTSGKFRFRMMASNSFTAAHSHTFSSKVACRNSIKSLAPLCEIAEIQDTTVMDSDENIGGRGIYQIYKDNDNKYRFRLKSANGSVVLTSQGYVAKENCFKAVARVKYLSTNHSLIDNTIKAK